MKQLFIKNIDPDKLLILRDKDFHYLIHVQRRQVGDRLRIIDETGLSYKAEISEINEDTCSLIITGEVDIMQNASKIVLFQCLPKGKKLDSIIRQTTEGGIHTIIPVKSQYAIPDFTGKDISKKADRWKKIAIEAAQQSGASPIPVVEHPITFNNMLSRIKSYSLFLFFHQEPLEQTCLHEYLSSYPQKIALLIGPEGGFSVTELKQLYANNAQPVNLGPTVLRTETAGLYALGAVRSILLEYEKWQIK